MSMGGKSPEVDWGDAVTASEWRAPMPDHVFRELLLKELCRIADVLEDLSLEEQMEH
jgi:hypothetical protein